MTKIRNLKVTRETLHLAPRSSKMRSYMVTERARDAFRGVADPVRRALLESLSVGGRSVAELAAGFPISRPAISKHLRVLRENGLVTEHRQGRQRIYELVTESLEEIVAWAAAVAEGAEPGQTELPKARVRRVLPPGRERRRPPSGAEEPAESGWREW